MELFSNAQLNELAWAIDADGLGRHEAQADAVVGFARSLGVVSPLVDVLADRAVPAPVRERALGKVIHAVVAARATGSPEWALAN